ncbi:MAG: hypothetical protein WC379_15620 [Methanoregula sp.]|jgi:hypothetical protein
MVPDIFSYPDSIFSPFMKVLPVVFFVTAIYIFYRCRIIYGGKLRLIATLLLLGGIAGILASLFRFAGDYFVAWKWLESTFFLALAIITLVIAYIVRLKLKNAIRLFGLTEGGDQE